MKRRKKNEKKSEAFAVGNPQSILKDFNGKVTKKCITK